MGKVDFLTIKDFGRDELDLLLDLATTLKEAWRAGRSEPRLAGKVLACVFHKPSLRTRISFEVGMAQLGGAVALHHRRGDRLRQAGVDPRHREGSLALRRWRS